MFSLCQGLSLIQAKHGEARNRRGNEATEEQRLQDLGRLPRPPQRKAVCSGWPPNERCIPRWCLGSWSSTNSTNSTNSTSQLCNICNMEENIENQETSNDGFVLVDSRRSSNLCFAQLLPVYPRLILDLEKDLTSPEEVK